MINYIKNKLIDLMAFLRLLDENAQLSLTNISVMLVLWKAFIMPEISIMELTTLLGVLGTYQFKRYTQRKKDEKK